MENIAVEKQADSFNLKTEWIKSNGLITCIHLEPKKAVTTYSENKEH